MATRADTVAAAAAAEPDTAAGSAEPVPAVATPRVGTPKTFSAFGTRSATNWTRRST